MYLKIFFNILLIIFLTILQFSFISTLPGALKSINIILVTLLFILVLGELEIALWWAIGAGFLFDIFSFLPFGAYLFSFCLTIIITNFLLINFFTNRSLYSFFLLSIFQIFFYELFINSINYLSTILGYSNYFLIPNLLFWKEKLAELILNLALVLTLFYLVNFITNRLKPVFLIKKR